MTVYQVTLKEHFGECVLCPKQRAALYLNGSHPSLLVSSWSSMNSLDNTLREKLPSLTTQRRVRRGGLLYIGKWVCFQQVNCEFLFLAQSFALLRLGKTFTSSFSLNKQVA